MNRVDVIREMIDSLGGQTATAAALRVSQPTVSGWLNGKHGVSARVALRAERLTGIPASQLCPDLAETAA